MSDQPVPPPDPVTEASTKGERTRAAIVEAGYRLFVRRGYTATSMRQIADEVGLSLGAAYNHFAGKEDLWRAVVYQYHPFHEIMPALEAAQGDTVEELVRDAAARMTVILNRREDLLNLMFVELVEFEGRHIPELFEAFFPPLLDFFQRFTQASGALREIPSHILLRAFIGLFFSYYITELLLGSQLPPEMKEGGFDRIADIYLRGILAEGD